MAADRPPSTHDRPPPRRSASGSAGSSRAKGARRIPIAAAGSRPPTGWLAGAAATLGFTAVCFWIGSATVFAIGSTGREIDFNALGYFAGCFVSILMLYRFLVADNQARNTDRYSDWQVLGARRVIGWMTFAGWVLGAVHLWFWVLDLTRP